MVGDNIRKARKAYIKENGQEGLTLEALAEMIDSTSGTLSHIEKGSRQPSLEMLEKIAGALKTTSHALLAEDSQAENNYFNELNRMAFPDASEKVSQYLDRDLKNAVEWGQAVIKEQQTTQYGNFAVEDLQPVTVHFVKIPVLGRIAAGLPLEAKENIIGHIPVPENEVNGSYFFLVVQGDSMINCGIKDGYRVLVRRQSDVENGEIAVVRVNSHDATLKRVRKIDGQVILYPDNPDYDPIIIKEEGAEIIGKVIKVEFDPNKKYQ